MMHLQGQAYYKAEAGRGCVYKMSVGEKVNFLKFGMNFALHKNNI